MLPHKGILIFIDEVQEAPDVMTTSSLITGVAIRAI